MLLISFNNDNYGKVDRYTMREETMEYFRYNKFMNLSAIDKTTVTVNPMNIIEYDFYDYLDFLINDRLFQVNRNPYKVIGIVRVAQARVNTTECTEFVGSSDCSTTCYEKLQSSDCTPLYSSSLNTSFEDNGNTCAYKGCDEYELNISEKVNDVYGSFGTYKGGSLYAADFSFETNFSTVITALKANNWLDYDTRAIIIRFTVYNHWVSRYLFVKANIEIPTENFFRNSFFISSLSLRNSEDGIVTTACICLLFNSFIFLVKIIFELSIGLSIITNLLEILN
jgi:hypothetical protein